jgi:hypothetical protein
MNRGDKTIRKVLMGTVCALALSCALAMSASAQDSTSTTKPAASKKSSSSTAHNQSSSTHSTGTSSSPAKKTSGKSSGKKSRRKSSRVRGQQKIDAQRAQAIQEALVREHYLKGDPTGTWNQASEDAMRKYQADHGWQSKTVPDSRALISLGLGPSKDHLLNPESAMTTVPDAPKSEGLPTTSHTTPAAATAATPASTTPATSANPSATEPSSPH